MSNKREVKIKDAKQEVKWYRERIIDMVNQIEDVWILKTVHNFIVGMIKEGD